MVRIPRRSCQARDGRTAADLVMDQHEDDEPLGGLSHWERTGWGSEERRNEELAVGRRKRVTSFDTSTIRDATEFDRAAHRNGATMGRTRVCACERVTEREGANTD